MTLAESSQGTSCTVSQNHVLYSEILSVTSAMRKNSRWASSTHFVGPRDTSLSSNLGLRISTSSSSNQMPSRGNKELELMAGFQELKKIIKDVKDLNKIELPVILSPFFAIIRSPLSTGPITSAALSALYSFFICGIINPTSNGIEHALVELSSTVSHCKFETSDSSGDEVVLLKIMAVIERCMCGETGKLLGDIEICEMLETVLTTCCQIRLSETLRRSAENTMHALVRTAFARLYDLDPESEEAKLRAAEDLNPEAEIKVTVSSQLPTDGGEAITSNSLLEEAQMPEPKEAGEQHIPAPNSRSQYGLPSIVELLRVLINVLDPNDQQHTDYTRLIALGILNAALEEAGPRMAQFPSLEALLVDSGCKFLFQLARSENFSILHLSLRTISALFETMQEHLKLQQELFLAFTIDRLALPVLSYPSRKGQTISAAQRPYPDSPRPGTSATSSPKMLILETEPESEKGFGTPSRILVAPARGETRPLIFDILTQISRHPSFMVDLYVNYDCDINCENLFERLIDFLTKTVNLPGYPHEGAQQKIAQYVCLDLMLAFVNDMATRADGHKEPWPDNLPTPESLLQTKSQKKLILTGAARFNSKPKSGIAFLEENGLIYSDLSPEVSKAQSLATFLKSCTRLDKRLLGDFISRPDNIDILKAFIGLFDFHNKPIAEAMRELLESFRLPGEAQQISRIAETFASIYFASGPEEIKSEDAVYVLTYSIIMLNTDQHNPQIRKRMTFEDYQKNLKGVNSGGDFSPEFLQNIFDSIRKREIVMPEEHTGQVGFEYAWKELLARSRQSGKFLIRNTSLFDMDMFKAVWKPVILAITFAFINFEEESITQRAIAGLRQCATLSRHFRLPDVLDFLVVSLSEATSLFSNSLPAQVPNYPVIDIEGQSITISSLSVKFGTNFKGQLAAVVLFNIVNGNGNALREGWMQIFEMFQNLFLHSLLPTRMLQMEDFLGGVSMIPLRGSQPPRPSGRADGGLLSALSSYLLTPYGASAETMVPDATDADVENTLCTIDCITSCRLDEFYSQITQLDVEALVAAVRALEALAHERTVTKVKHGSDDGSTHQEDTFTLPYDPASVFLLETMISIVCHAPQHIEELWSIVFEHLSALLSASVQYSVLLIERAVVGLLRVCLILAQESVLRDQIYVSFDLLAGLPSSVATSVGEQVIAGLILILQKHRHIVNSQTEWNLVFAMTRSTMSNLEAARLSYELTASFVVDGPDQLITMDNFSGLVNVLDDFASAAGSASQARQVRGRRMEPLTTTNSPVVARGKRAVELLCSIQTYVPDLLESARVTKIQAWRQTCLPLLTSLSRQSTNAAREIRHLAISQLQRILLGPQVILDEGEQTQVEEIFNRVVFPLLDDLLKPEVFLRDPQGMAETRLRGSVLLCKIFMHLEVRDNQTKADFRILWIQILDLLDRLMNIDKGDQLHEAVPESLKNVLLVMNSVGILLPAPSCGDDNRDERQRTLWIATQERMERFLPGFLADIIPTPPK